MADDNDKPLSNWEKWQQRAANAQANADKRQFEQPKQLFLPGFDIGTMPNHLNRSSLFAPVARGRRKLHNDTVMVSRSDCVLEYSGEQLDEADADLIMALIWFAQRQPIGELVELNRKALLRRVKTGKIGSSQYEWLHRALKRLRKATLVLEAKKPDGSRRYQIGKMQTFDILKALEYDDQTEAYVFALDPRWVKMFSNREYARLDWDARMQIGRGLDMAKTLQRLIACSNDKTQRYALDRLKQQMQYGSPIRKFRHALMAAVAELQRLRVVTDGNIETSTKGKLQLVIHRVEN